MNCKKCGKPLNEGATFCIYCGERADGKATCPNCGSVLEDGAAFCSTCGCRVDGKRICSYCGEELSEQAIFCPKCGKKAFSKEMPRTAKRGFARIEQILSPIFLVVAMAVLFICSFFNGVKTKSMGISETTKIYYFFGEAYDVLKSLSEQIGKASYLPTIMCTIFVILGVDNHIHYFADWLYKTGYRFVQ